MKPADVARIPSPFTSPLTLAMKIRCCRRRTVFSIFASRSGSSRGRPEFHLRQWVSPSSTRLSLVTTVAAFDLHFIGSDGIQLHPEGWPGTTPVSQALPWALAWSTILCCPPHTGWPSLYSRAGWHLRHGVAHAERRTACPSSDGTTRDEDGSCFKDRRACRSPWTTL